MTAAPAALLRRYVHGNGEDDPLLWYEGWALRYLQNGPRVEN
jgi:hypothetical protein